MIVTTESVESKGGTESSEDWNFWYVLQNKKVDNCKCIQWSILCTIDLLKYSTLRVF